MRLLFNILLFLSPAFGFSQLIEGFDDGNFTQNPIWSGDDSVFVIDNTTGNPRLRSNKLIPSSTFYLSTANPVVNEGQWEFTVQLQFNTSGTNFVDFYLKANQADLKSATLSGYFVRIGGTPDEVSLYKKVNGVNTKIIDGVDGVTNSSNNLLKIKITQDPTFEWKLERDVTGTGNTWFTEGTVNDNVPGSFPFLGVSITQSTASFFQKHFFDDIYAGPIIFDTQPPTLVSATATSATMIDVLFSEAILPSSASTLSNFSLSLVLSLVSATPHPTNASIVQLQTAVALQNGTTYTLTTTNVADQSNNESGTLQTTFSYLVAEEALPGDVILTEFFADPSPRIGLPELEFVEIYNKSSKYFNLTGWKLGDNATQGTVQSAWLAPGEYKVLCPTSAVDSFPNAVGVTSFPSLNNSGDDISISDASQVLLDKISYTDAWYRDEVKKDGGYTIELINPNDLCSDAQNWIASTSALGGTPAAQNSVFDDSPDSTPPTISSIVALAPNYVEVYFSEGMDSLSIVNATFDVLPFNSVENLFLTEKYPSKATYQLVSDLIPSQVYTYLLSSVEDCWTNSASFSGTFSLPEIPLLGDLIINEILHDPLTGGSDFVELYNVSDKYINLNTCAVANYDDTIGNIKPIVSSKILGPKEYIVLTADSSFIKTNYPATVSGKFIQMSLPNYNNDSSTVFLLANGQVIDQVSYTKDFHFKLIDNIDGKSLERINPIGNSNDPRNWQTAAEAIGFATPGAKNSQYLTGEVSGTVSLTNELFSPDQDGFEDVLQINYGFEQAGYVGTITIYDERGRLIRTLMKSELLGSEGSVNWDGISDNNLKASVGVYVILVEAYQIDGGEVFKKRISCVLAGKI